MHTEAEAQLLWCPFGRPPRFADMDEAPAVNRTAKGAADHGSLCLASGCMAWKRRLLTIQDENGQITDYTPDPAGVGYCGLAGA